MACIGKSELYDELSSTLITHSIERLGGRLKFPEIEFISRFLERKCQRMLGNED